MSHRHFVFGVLPLLLVTCGAGQMQPVRVWRTTRGSSLCRPGRSLSHGDTTMRPRVWKIRPSCRLKRSNGTSLILKNMGANVAPDPFRKITIPQAMYLDWIDLFCEIGPEMTGQAKVRR